MLHATAEKDRKINFIERHDDRLYLISEAGTHRLEPKNSRTVRISYTQNKDFSQKKKPGVTYQEVYPYWEHTQNQREVIFHTEELQIVIDLETASFSCFDQDGNRLLSEYGWELEEFTTYRMLEEEAQIEKAATADGVKDVVKEAPRVPDGSSFHTRIYLEWSGEEALYGLGQHEEGFASLKGQTVYVHQANRKIAVPMLISTKGYGILTDTYSPMIFSDTVYGSYIYTEADSEIDFYFICGGSMDGVINEYRILTGKAAMLPKWAFGYIQSQERYETQQEVINTAEEYRKREIGLDGIVLDWCSWEDGLWGQKTFDPVRFPEPEEMLRRLHEEHIHFMLSIWPNMDEHTDNYREFKEHGLLLPGCNVYNALSAKGRKLYWKQVKNGLPCRHIDAWWCDSSEPFTPEWNHSNRPEPAKMYEEFCRTAALHLPAEEMNAYSLYHSRTVYEGQRSECSGRVFNLTRSASIGQQRYAAVMWSGDIDASWNTLRRQIAAGLHFSASGLPYWTVDIGAFFVKKGNIWYWKGDYDRTTEDLGYRELFVRWYQWAVFLPVFRGHGTDCRRELWHFANSVDISFYDALLEANRLRYELIPYIYSYAGLSWLENGSIIRPLAFQYPGDKNVWNIPDQYLFGRELMVCPITCPMYYGQNSEKLTNTRKSRKVYLPEADGWYDYRTGAYYEGGQWVDAEAEIDHIPVFVREGSILPIGKAALSTEEQSPEISLTVYGGKSGTFTLYEDAGNTYSYEEGAFCVTVFTWQEEEQKLTAESRNNLPDKDKRYRIENAVLVQKNGIDIELPIQ